MNQRFLLVIAGCAGTVLSGACDDSEDGVQPNPHFTAGNSSMSGAPAGGEAPGSGGSTDTPSGGAPDLGGASAVAGAGEISEAGSGGAGSPEPPYDCVLTPTTHLEIINACTDAARIEKHPELPPVE